MVGGRMGCNEEAEFLPPILEKYERGGHSLYFSAGLWEDGIIEPARSCVVLALSLSAALNDEVKETWVGV